MLILLRKAARRFRLAERVNWVGRLSVPHLALGVDSLAASAHGEAAVCALLLAVLGGVASAAARGALLFAVARSSRWRLCRATVAALV